MKRRSVLPLLSVAAFSLIFRAEVFSFDSTAEKKSRDRAILVKSDIEPTPVGALRYLESLIPTDNSGVTVARLIRQLGHEQFARREEAVAQLQRLPVLPREELAAATRSEDAEIRWRSHALLTHTAGAGNQAMLAALGEVAADPPPGSVDVLLRLAALNMLDNQRMALQESLRKVVRKSDLPRLEKAAGHGPPFVRLTAAYAWEGLTAAAGRTALAELLTSDQPEVVLMAAKYLGNVGDTRSLAPLAELFHSDQALIAEESAYFLSALAGRDFSFSHHVPAEREQAYQAARQWITTAGATAALKFPVIEASVRRGDLGGHTLLATGDLGRVVELDASGKEVWQFPVSAWSAEKLPSGNVLIASCQGNRLVEVDGRGEVVWNLHGINAMRAKPLRDGHILVADFGGSRALELNTSRDIVWSVKTPDNCFDVDRLPNGNTIVACPNVIREIDREGAVVRELRIEGRANSVQVLPSGSWLVANYQRNKVEQYNRQGQVEWEFNEPQPCDAFRMRSGHVLITTARRAVEITAEGKVVQEIAATKYGCARR